MSNEHSKHNCENVFEEKKTKTYQILERIPRLYFLVGLNHSVKGVLQGSACALSVHCPPFTQWRARTAALPFNTPFTDCFSPTKK